jgi:type I restriction enzyme, S subunit
MSASATVPEGYKQTEIGVFPKDWEIKKFDDIFDFKSTASNSRSDLTETDEAHYIHYGDIHTIFHRHLDILKKSTPRIDLSLCKNATRIRNGDWVMADASEDFSGICKAIEISGIDEDKSVVAGLHTFLLRDRNEEYSPGFKGHLGEAKFLHDQYVRVSVGLKVFGVTKTSLRDLLIPVPPKHQQIKVEEILTQADAQIQSFEHFIAKKRYIKQGTMQELLTGNTRLPGFTDEWQMKVLGDVGKVRMCKRIFNHETNTSGDVPFYKIGTFGKAADAYISQDLYDSYRNKFAFPDFGSILISAAGTIGRTVIYRGEDAYFQDSNIIWIENSENLISNLFLYHLLKVVNYTTEGGTIQRLYNSIVSNTAFTCPPKLEQEAIAEVLSDMDAEIAALEERLEKAKAIKQGMMQQLLTGKIRLVD